MENQELDLVKIQTDVEKLTQLQATKEELNRIVKISSAITVPDLTNQGQVAIAKESRLKLRKVEISIEKEAKSYRDVFTTISKKISCSERELLAITSPEIERIEAIEAKAKAIEIKNARIALLTEQREELTKIGDEIEVEDEELLAMDNDAFWNYKNQRVANKNDADRLAVEKAQLALEAEKEAMQREKETQEREKVARIEAQLEAEKSLALAEKEAEIRLQQEKTETERRVVAERERMEQEQKAKEEKVAQEKIEAEKLEKETQEKLENQKKYQSWLKENNYNETEYKIINGEKEINLYKLVSVFKK